MRRRLLPALLLLAALAAGAWWWTRPVAVPVATLVRGDAAEVVYATGVVEPVRWAEVTPLARARIVETCRCEGEAVEAGQVLFRLDDAAPRARLGELETRLDLAEKSLARIEPLVQRRVAPLERLDEAEAEVAELRAAVAAAEAELADLVIRSPMKGVALRVDAEVGEVASPGETLAWVGEPRPLRIVAEVNEEDIPRVETGQRALLKADAFPDRALEAEVASITPMGDPTLKTYRVYLSLPGNTPLMIGMSVEVNVILRVKAGVTLAPAAALVEGALLVLAGERLERRPVETGIAGPERVEIVSGAEPGEVVVSPADAALAEGARVRPAAPPAAAP